MIMGLFLPIVLIYIFKKYFKNMNSDNEFFTLRKYDIVYEEKHLPWYDFLVF